MVGKWTSLNKINGHVCMARSQEKWAASANFQFLSPVRLPFRHTGGFSKTLALI
jgi:hypothetical protein